MIVNNLHVDHCKFLGPELIQSLEVIPDPVSLIESMRAVGYTTETAIADIVDNSISAGAPHILIEYDASRDPFVAILDDGHGMDATELTNAMRHGSSNPNALRAHHDLGRFGLGLKTASLSQCRKLTVVSKKNGTIQARCWDIDYLQSLTDGKWAVLVPDQRELELLPLYQNLADKLSGNFAEISGE